MHNQRILCAVLAPALLTLSAPFLLLAGLFFYLGSGPGFAVAGLVAGAPGAILFAAGLVAVCFWVAAEVDDLERDLRGEAEFGPA